MRSIILLFLGCLFLVSCTDKKKTRNTNLNINKLSKIVSDEKIDIAINSKLCQITTDDYSDEDLMTFTIVKEDDDIIEIVPKSKYFSEYSSSKRMQLWDDGWKMNWSDYLEYPMFDYTITNTTNKPLKISSLTLAVEESQVDTFPYLWIYENCGKANSLTIWNESWYNWGNIIMSYSILKKGEPFDGKYKKKITIPYFSDFIYVDFLPDLIELGLEENHIRNFVDHDPLYTKEEQEKMMYAAKSHVAGHRSAVEDIILNPLNLENRNIDCSSLFHPFEYSTNGIFPFGFARIYGKIEFSSSNFKKEFKGNLYLTPPDYGGAAFELSDKYDVTLRPEGHNYELSVPYTAVLQPGRSVKVRLTIKCSKSAVHNFRVKANNTEGLNISTKEIHLRLINSRHSTKQPQVLEEYPPIQ